MSKNCERALLCNRVTAAGFTNPRKVARIARVKLSTAADVLVKVRDAAQEHLLYGVAQTTGKTRTYSNGAIGTEIRCAACGLTYWETGMPFAKCVDCRGTKRKGKVTT